MILINLEDLGLNFVLISVLQGGDVDKNVEIFKNIFQGKGIFG